MAQSKYPRTFINSSFLPSSSGQVFRDSIDFNYSDFSKVRVIFWGPTTSGTAAIYKSFISKLRRNRLFCFPILFEENIPLFDVNNLERYFEFVDSHNFNQLHILLPERMDFTVREKVAFDRLKAIFYLCLLSVRPSVNFIICDYPVITSESAFHRLFFQHLNLECERVVSLNGGCNVFIFDTSFLNYASDIFICNRVLTIQGHYLFCSFFRPFLFKVILDISCRSNRVRKRHLKFGSEKRLNFPKFHLFRDDFQNKIPFILRWPKEFNMDEGVLSGEETHLNCFEKFKLKTNPLVVFDSLSKGVCHLCNERNHKTTECKTYIYDIPSQKKCKLCGGFHSSICKKGLKIYS